MADKPKSVIEEAGLDPAQWAEVDAAPIVPGKTPAPVLRGNGLGNFYSGSIPSSLQHDADFVKTGYDTGLAIEPLMPVSPSGTPSNVAAIVSTVGSTPAPVPSSTGMTFKGFWNSYTTYSIGNVVIFNVSAYVATKSGVNKQPDLSVPSFWALLSENLAFNASVIIPGNPGFGPFDTNSLTFGSYGSATSSITPGVSSGLALLSSSISNGTPGLSGWGDVGTAVGVSAEGLYIKSFNTNAVISSSQSASSTENWATNLSTFQSDGQSLTSSITSVQIASNVATIVCTQDFTVGTKVVCSGLSGASFLDGSVLTILSNTGTQFTAAFTNADYGPTADSGTAQNLPYLQSLVLINGGFISTGTYTGNFANPIKPGSTIFFWNAVNDVNGKSAINSVGSPSGLYTIENNQNPGSGSCSNTAFAQDVIGGGTSVSITVTTNLTAGCIVAFELPGGGSAGGVQYLPYDVEQFRGSMFVCNAETTQDAFADPSSWWKLAQGTGFTDALSGTYAPDVNDYGRLLYNSSGSSYTVNLPNPPPNDSWWIALQNVGTGTTVISPGSANLDGVNSSITLDQNQGILVFTDGTNYWTQRGFGTVFSVALAVPGIFNLSGSPVTSNGTITIGLQTQSANTAWMGPATGSAATPTFRVPGASDFTAWGIPYAPTGPVDLMTQSTAITPTTLYAVPSGGSGQYRITFNAKVTQAATTSCILGGTNGFQIVYTDADDSVAVTTPASVPFGSTAASLTTNTTQNQMSGSIIVNAKASTNIQYSMDYTSVGVTAMEFSLHIRIEKLP